MTTTINVSDRIKIVPSELSIVPSRIKAIWDEADEKKLSIQEIVETVKKVRKQVYNEEYRNEGHRTEQVQRRYAERMKLI